MFKKITLFLILTAIVFSLLQEQGTTQTRSYDNRNNLNRLRQEIDDYRQKIKTEQKKEDQILDNLAKLDREIDITHELIIALKKEEKQKLKVVGKIGKALKTKQDELKRLQEIYKKRMIMFYKYGRIKDIELLLSSKSFNQTLTWFKYLRLLSENDRRNYHNILKKKQKIETQKNNFKKELIAKRKIIDEKTVESKRLKISSEKRNELLTTVQQNKQIYLQKLQQYQASAKEIQRLIVAEEQKRLKLEDRGIFEATDFPKLKGRMIWPTDGHIINHFGKHKHPKWKTVTENIGVDIKTEFGQEVRSVAKGIVTAITWQRGRGNIVIVNHMGGYFSVYTHLSQILVQIDDKIDMGQAIGNVGDTGSLQGAMLHFEIWKSNQVLNPEKWLI